MKRLVLSILVILGLLAAGGAAAFRFSPWPSALLVRQAFDKDSARTNAALAERVPAGVRSQLDLTYDPADRNGRLDLYLPPAGAAPDGPLPVVVWVHGGGWVSGDKGQIGNYLKILAARGFATVSIAYTIAPEARYPTPVRQVNAALGWLDANAEPLGLDRDRIFLAGDSAGSQIAAQVANLTVDPAYARLTGIKPSLTPKQLRGVVLHCGAYDAALVDMDGPMAGFIRTVVWAYLGRRDFQDDPRVGEMSVIRHLSPAFPPIFISGGNADPLTPQSSRLAEVARDRGVAVDALFYPADHQPALAHEYQFNLDLADARTALDRSAAFLNRHAAPLNPAPAAPGQRAEPRGSRSGS